MAALLRPGGEPHDLRSAVCRDRDHIRRAGDGSTTFTLPDLRGRVAAGKDNMGGTAASRLTSVASGVNGTSLGAAGGSETHTLTSAQMPSHTHGVSDPGHVHGASPSGSLLGNNGSGVGLNSAGGTLVNYSTSIASSATGISIQSAGSGGAHNNTQPTLVLNYIIKA